MEIWKSPPGYQGLYEVSNLGNIRSMFKTITQSNGHRMTFPAKQLKKYQNANGYLYVELCKNGKHRKWKMHRLVATTFLKNPKGLPIVNHKDENKLNNCVENLEWCTWKQNVGWSLNLHPERTRNGQPLALRKANNQKSKAVACFDSKGNLLNRFSSIHKAARKIGAEPSNISQCCRGVLKTAKGFQWRYIDIPSYQERKNK